MVEIVFPEESTRETVAAGIELTTRRWVDGRSGPFAAQVLEVDPRTPAVNILPARASDRSAGRETTSAMAARYGAVAAVNGGYFTPEGASTGIYVWNQQTIAQGKGRSAIVWCKEQDFIEDARIAVIDSGSTARPCPAMDIVGAGPRLVEAGAANIGDGENFAHAKVRHPRTAFATTNRGTMLFVTVDGRQERSAGMTLEELATELVRLGAVEAINLDGGGSTTMVAAGVIRNKPSDGQERPVSDALLIFSIASLDDLTRLVEKLAATPRLLSPGLAGQLTEALKQESMENFRRLVAAATPEQCSWQALRLLEEAAALLH
jgi:exopolysaccharide biosynthesis protein